MYVYVAVLLVPGVMLLLAPGLLAIAGALKRRQLLVAIWTWMLGVELYGWYVFVHLLANTALQYTGYQWRWILFAAAEIMIGVALLTWTPRVVQFVLRPRRWELARITIVPSPRAATAMVRCMGWYYLGLAVVLTTVKVSLS